MRIDEIDRRGFLRGAGAATMAAGGISAANAQSSTRGTRLVGEGAGTIYAGMTLEEVKKVFPQLNVAQFSLPGALPKITGTQAFSASAAGAHSVGQATIGFMVSGDGRVVGICTIFDLVKLKNYSANQLNDALIKEAVKKENNIEDSKKLEGADGRFAFFTRFTRSGIIGNTVVTGVVSPAGEKVTGVYLTTKATSLPAVLAATPEPTQPASAATPEPAQQNQQEKAYSKTLGVKGIMIGMSPVQVEGRLQSLKIPIGNVGLPGTYSKKVDSVFSGADKNSTVRLPFGTMMSVAGQDLTSPEFEFINNRLEAIRFSIFSKYQSVGAIADALDNKYGKNSKVTKIKTRNGVEHDNIIGTWKTPDGAITLEQHKYQLDTGELVFAGTEKMKQIGQANSDQTKKNQDDI